MIKWNQRGDTIVEVAIAFAILAMVLIGAYVTAHRAFDLGQTSRERSQLINYAQQQAEALKSFRDSHDWTEFVNGSNAALTYTNCDHAPADFCGVKDRDDAHPNSGLNCTPTSSPLVWTKCFHMALRTINVAGGQTEMWVPVPYALATGYANAHVGIVSADADPGSGTPQMYTFNLNYGEDSLGSDPHNQGKLTMELVNLDGLR